MHTECNYSANKTLAAQPGGVEGHYGHDVHQTIGRNQPINNHKKEMLIR